MQVLNLNPQKDFKDMRTEITALYAYKCLKKSQLIAR